MGDGFEIAEKNNIDFKDIVSVRGNVVNVKLNDKSGYSYAFFNDVRLEAYPDSSERGMYILAVVKN